MKETKTGCNLNTCLMCRLCIKEWIPAIKANKKNYQVNKGDLLFKEGEPVTGIYFVNSGTVKVHKHWDEEKDLIVRFARTGDIVGHRGLGQDNLFPVSATAIESSGICFVEIDFFLSTLRTNSGFLFELMMFYASELKESERNMRNLAHMPVKGRIAQSLFTLHHKFGTTLEGAINLVVSRQDLASYTGTTYETFFRILNELKNENIIELTGKTIAIRDMERLLLLTQTGDARFS